MYKKSVPTGESPVVIVDVQGSLNLKGWENSEVLAMCDSEEDLTLEAHEDEIRIECQRDCDVRVPYQTSVQIARLEGNANIKLLEERLSLGDVSGNLNLRSVGAVEADGVHGNLTARNIAGDLRVDTVEGNLIAKDIDGNLLIEGSVEGNLVAKDIDGDLDLHGHVEGNLTGEDIQGNARGVAQGNINLRLDPSPGKSHEFDAQGNLVCRLPADTSVEVEITEASNLKVNLPEVELPRNQETPVTFTLGEGDASLKLSARGQVLLSSLPVGFHEDFDFDFDLDETFHGSVETITEQVSQQIQTQMEMLEEQLNAQLSNLSSWVDSMQLSPEQADRISQRAREVSERVSARTQEKLQRAQEKLNRKLEAARRRAEMKARAAERAARDRRRKTDSFSWTTGRGAEPAPPPPPSEPVSEEEHLLILQMLEQGKISIEEAEKLLQALEGKR